MNERLKELYLQAHSTRHYDGDPALDSNPPTVYWQGEVSAQRFAELIVRECIKHIGDNMEYAKIDTADNKERFLEVFRVSGGFFINEIKEHFGVKE